MSADANAAPLYSQIKRELRTGISRGQYVAGEPFITQRELCERYQVSTTTAVRALNELVQEGLLVRRRGRGTFVVESPSSSSFARTTSIVCIVPGLDNPHLSQIVRGVGVVCTELGISLTLSQKDYSAEHERQVLREAVDGTASGVILLPVEGSPNGDLLAELRSQGRPVVLIDRYRTDMAFDAVLVDDFAIGYHVTRRLLDLGHRTIAVLLAETDCTSTRGRVSGHLRALHDAGIPMRPALSLLRPYSTEPDDVRLPRLRELLGMSTPPTVLLCGEGYTLAQAARDVQSLGLRIPDDIDLAATDKAGPYDVVSLAAVSSRLPSFQMGQEAMRLLATRMRAEDPYADSEHVVLPVEILDREGTATQLLPGLTHQGHNAVSVAPTAV